MTVLRFPPEANPARALGNALRKSDERKARTTRRAFAITVVFDLVDGEAVELACAARVDERLLRTSLRLICAMFQDVLPAPLPAV